jgi:hypothetical protein
MIVCTLSVVFPIKSLCTQLDCANLTSKAGFLSDSALNRYTIANMTKNPSIIGARIQMATYFRIIVKISSIRGVDRVVVGSDLRLLSANMFTARRLVRNPCVVFGARREWHGEGGMLQVESCYARLRRAGGPCEVIGRNTWSAGRSLS